MTEHLAFANLPNREFVNYLREHGLTPNSEEIQSQPVRSAELKSGIELSILEITGQRFGESIAESSGK